MSLCPPIVWKNLPANALITSPDLANHWDRLNAERGDLPFLSAQAMDCALHTFGNGTERLLVGRLGREHVALFLLVPLGTGRWQTFQPSQIPLGAWVAQAGLSLQGMARSLIRGPLRFSLSLSITQVDPRLAEREDDLADSESGDYIETGWIDLQGTFVDYWNARGKNLRQNMRKQKNKLAAENVVGQMRSIEGPADMAAAIARYGALESAGWKASRGTAIHPDNAQGRFYTTLLEGSAQRGEAVVYEYLFDDRIVASNLCLRRSDTLIVLKTTYDESIQFYSPAFLLSHDELERLYAAGVIKRLEYYGRLMDWHTKWTQEKRTLYHLTMYRCPALKRFAEWRRNRSSRAQ